MRRTFASRAAMSRFNVPLILDSCEVRGSFTERGTEARAPWWRMKSTPSQAALMPLTSCRSIS